MLGFEAIKKHFEKSVLAHAYLFHGQDMIGKRTFAMELAGRLADSSDIFLMGHDIDSARDAKHFLSLSPLNGTKKIVIIDEADKLTEEAQNALLKFLEEPSASSVIILVTSRPEALLATISSRVQHIFFASHPASVVHQFLENKKLSEEQKKFLYEFSNGSIGLLARIEDFKSIKMIAEEFTAFAKADVNKRFDVAKKLAEDGALEQKILFWMLYLRSKKLYKPLPSLLTLYHTVSNPSFNKQLAIENFMLGL